MAMKAHLETLTLRHEKLDATIAAETKRPSHDDLKLVELKRQKLRIKDQLEELRQKSRAN